MKKMLVLTLVIFYVFLFVPIRVDARSGCCSHHGGVCGCGCCDGTSLSATCAPYYPNCNSSPVRVVPTTPSCDINAYYSSLDSKCHCNSGYCVNTSKTGCVVLPKNAHCVDSSSDAWVCDMGYVEVSSHCLPDSPVNTDAENPVVPVTNLSHPSPNIDISTKPTDTSVSDGNGAINILAIFGGIFVLGKFLGKNKKS